MFKSCIPTQDHITRPKPCHTVPGNGDHGIIGCQAGKNAILMRCRVAWWPGPLGVDLTEPDQHIGGAQSLPHRLQDDWMTHQPGGLRANPVSPSGKMWKSPLIKKNMSCVFSAFKKLHIRFPQKSERLEITRQLCGPGVQQVQFEAFFSHQLLCPGSVWSSDPLRMTIQLGQGLGRLLRGQGHQRGPETVQGQAHGPRHRDLGQPQALGTAATAPVCWKLGD